MTIPARISIVTLRVADLTRAQAFYMALGWERCSASSDEICWFRTADSYLGLFPHGLLAVDARVAPGTPGAFGGITRAICLESERR